MKMRFEQFYRLLLIFLVAIVAWSLIGKAPAQNTGTTNEVKTTQSLDRVQIQLTGETRSNLNARTLTDQERAVLSLGLSKVSFFQRSLFGIPIWQYFSSIIFIFLAFIVAKLVDYIVQQWLKKLVAKTETKFDDILVNLLHGPVKVISFVIVLHIGLKIYEWPTWLSIYISKGLTIIIAFSLTYVAIRFSNVFLDYWRDRKKETFDNSFDKNLYVLLKTSIKVFLIIIAVLVTAQNLGIEITSALASLSIGGLALSLAAQDSVANFFGAVSIFVDRPFKIGDRIKLDNIDGIVESIGFRSTRIRNLDGFLVTVPNKTMGNATIINVTARPNIKTVMNIGITYNTPPEKIKLALQILEDVFRKSPNTVDLLLSFDKFNDFSLNLLVVHWWSPTDYKQYLEGMKEFNLEIKKRFDEANIEFAFPTQTIYLKQDSKWEVSNINTMNS